VSISEGRLASLIVLGYTHYQFKRHLYLGPLWEELYDTSKRYLDNLGNVAIHVGSLGVMGNKFLLFFFLNKATWSNGSESSRLLGGLPYYSPSLCGHH